jgi:uncharacterized cupredoxin-like copper-binding protein
VVTGHRALTRLCRPGLAEAVSVPGVNRAGCAVVTQSENIAIGDRIMHHWGRNHLLVTAAAAAFALTGCSSTSGARVGGASPTTASTASAAAKGTPVSVVEKEFSISLTPATLTAGTHSFTVHNEGSFAHNLNIQGPGVSQQASATVSPGQSAVLTVTLEKGSYELWCSVDSHKDRGMDLMLSVG